MIIKADAKGLEVVCAAYLSRDPIMMKELLDGVDIHGENQKILKLTDREDGRLIAKRFKFRTIYGGTEYAFAQDPDFMYISSNTKYWKKQLEAYFQKYQGLAKWHEKIITEVINTGRLITPTGRILTYEPVPNYRGELVWPITTIKNYPVQSFGADVMSIIRVSFMKRFKDARINGILINTVHDDIVVDVMEPELEKVRDLFVGVFNDMPRNFKRLFLREFDLPLKCELSYGNNMKELTELK